MATCGRRRNHPKAIVIIFILRVVMLGISTTHPLPLFKVKEESVFFLVVVRFHSIKMYCRDEEEGVGICLFGVSRWHLEI